MKRLSNRPALAGIAFEITDLVLLQAWADLYGMRIVIELDYRTDDGGEYEELLVFYRPICAFRWCMAWRSASEIVVQLSNGQTQHFATLAEALDAMSLAGRPQQARNPAGKAGAGHAARTPRTRRRSSN